MKQNIFDILCIFWVCIVGFIIYKRNPSHNVIIICGIIITLISVKQTHTNDTLQHINRDDLEWLDTMLTTTNIEEKRRCYHILNEKLYQYSINKPKHNHEILQNILKNHKFEYPVPSNEYNSLL